MMAFTPNALSAAEAERLAQLTASVIERGGYADWVTAAKDGWAPAKLGTARTKALAARPRGDRCVYCQDNEGRELDHLRPRSLHPELAWCWSNLVPACGTCGGPTYKSARDAILDPSVPEGWRPLPAPRAAEGSPRTPPPHGATAWWNPRKADPLRAMKLDIVDGSFTFLVTATPGTPDHARISWTLKTLQLNHRSTLVRQRRVAYDAYRRWLDEVEAAHRAGDAGEEARLRADLADQNQPVVWAEMKRQRADLPDVDALLTAAPQVLAW